MLLLSLFEKQKPSSHSCKTPHNHRPPYGTITTLIPPVGAIGLDQPIQETSGMSQKHLNVLVSAGTELIFFFIASTVLCFGFSARIMLITH